MDSNSVWDHDLLAFASIQSEYAAFPVKRLVTLGTAWIFWEILHGLLCRATDRKTGMQLVAFIHSLEEVCATLYVVFNYHEAFSIPSSYCDAIPFAQYVFCATMGYFFWDLTIIYREWNELEGRKAWLVHCVLCLITFSIPTVSSYFHRCAFMALLYELSTIFMYIFQFWEAINYPSCKLIFQVLFSIVFLVVRIIGGTYIFFESVDPIFFSIIFDDNIIDHTCVWLPIKYLVAVINVLFYSLNLFWFGQIIQGYIQFFQTLSVSKEKSQ